MRNKAGQLAIVVPGNDDADIQAHGGKVVMPIRFVFCADGGLAWRTEPELMDGFGNTIAWDDRDLKPLGATEPDEHQRQTAQTGTTGD